MARLIDSPVPVPFALVEKRRETPSLAVELCEFLDERSRPREPADRFGADGAGHDARPN